ncbi:MAG: hypothetical protein H0U21_15815 [Acidimicrobiia bacterium]|nr:hypothetical protein [Acidimicrobiia bacterium]
MLDWNPDDPDTVKVHYDVAAWSVDQRAELSEALAEAELAHMWDGDEVVVPEELEAEADELFGRMEQLLGPFAVALDDDDPGVEYGLDEWPPVDRQTLTAALVEAEVPHRWDGTAVVVATDSESTVDELLDAIEQGSLVLAGTELPAEPPEGALSSLFTAADRLAKDPADIVAPEHLAELLPVLDAGRPPYGVSVGRWAKAVEAATELSALADDPDVEPSDVIGAAQELRSLVREYV